MKIKIKAKASRPEQIIDIPQGRAKAWLKSGEAEKVDESRTTKTQDNDSESN